jgi:tetratricopeptide (TPR) repeat protein
MPHRYSAHTLARIAAIHAVAGPQAAPESSAAAPASFGYWVRRRPLALDAALRRGDGDAGSPPGDATRCYYVLGLVQAYAQEPGAITNLRAAYDAYRARDDASGAAEAALRLGFYLWASEGDHAPASALVEASLAGNRARGDALCLADALNIAAILRWYAGDVAEAEAPYRESLQTARTVGNQLVALQATGGFAFVALARGQWDAAIELAQERLALAERLG